MSVAASAGGTDSSPTVDTLAPVPLPLPAAPIDDTPAEEFNWDKEEVDPFRNLTERLSLYNKAKFIFPGLLLIPLRLIMLIGFLSAAVLVCKVAQLGARRTPKGQPVAPIKGWRRKLLRLVPYLSRGCLLSLGFHRIKVTGTPASREEAPIVVANHAAPWEGFGLLYFSGTTFVSAAANLKAPLLGSILQGMQTISVDRNDPMSRETVINEIRRRARNNDFPPVGIFPEGTTINTKAMISFKTGAFAPGVPVQPVVVRFPFKFLDPTFSGARVGIGSLLLRLFSQFYNTMELHYLPVYVPSPAEKADPALFANNVRLKMAAKFNTSVTNHNLEDYFLQCEAVKLKLKPEDVIIGMDRVRRLTNMTLDDVKVVMRSFKKLDVSRTGTISYTDFIRALGIPDSAAVRKSFDVLSHGRTHIDFRQFLSSVMHVSKEISTEDQIKFAFDLADIDGDGRVTRRELGAIMLMIAPKSTTKQVNDLFRKMDSRHMGYIDLIEFGSFMRNNPAYMQVFASARGYHREKGHNPVLEMLQQRAEGKSVSVDDFMHMLQGSEDYRKQSQEAESDAESTGSQDWSLDKKGK